MSDKPIVNPIAAQADKAAEKALIEKVDTIITVRIKDLLPTLASLFAAALNEKREPTPEEIAAAIEVRGGEESGAFSNDNDGQAWYVRERLLPLVTVMAAGEDKKSQVALLRAYLFDQEFIKHLPKDKADEYLVKDIGETW